MRSRSRKSCHSTGTIKIKTLVPFLDPVLKFKRKNVEDVREEKNNIKINVKETRKQSL